MLRLLTLISQSIPDLQVIPLTDRLKKQPLVLDDELREALLEAKHYLEQQSGWDSEYNVKVINSLLEGKDEYVTVNDNIFICKPQLDKCSICHERVDFKSEPSVYDGSFYLVMKCKCGRKVFKCSKIE